ncbi:uncharacterized protein [Amphiura filiformis]|uniref:uncharacterized protein n=1 Tax=Amphiura filiformis TaxID=82378 RepID=UPI003B20D709
MSSHSMPPQHYTIGGVKVAFPCKAYPTQLSMMSMIIKGIDREQNCLLESPTGSGKSLALLCSSLAWQHNEYVKREQEMQEADKVCQDECGAIDECGNKKPDVVCVCNCAAEGMTAVTSPQASTSTNVPSVPINNSGQPMSASTSTKVPSVPINNSGQPMSEKGKSESDHGNNTEAKSGVDEEDDFQPAKKRFRTPIPMPRKIKHRGIMYEDDAEESLDNSPNPHTQAHWKMQLKNDKGTLNPTNCTCPCHGDKSKTLSTSTKDEKGKDKGPRRIPKIYFGTRTHKQIAQIIRELKKTAYRDSRMSILGSREYTCVHPRISKGPNKNEGCNELRKGKFGQSCTYYNGTHKIKQQWQLQDRGFTEAWDIEDLVKLGKKIKACPYFATRALKDEADVIFCPYNYLVDPVIRESMEISVKGQIIVLDEAHNIEDSAREAASYSVTEEQLQEAMDELERLIVAKWRQPHTGQMKSLCVGVKEWITNHSGNLRQADYNRALKVFSGQDIDGMLFRLGVVPDSLASFKHDLFVITEENNPNDQVEEMMGLSLSSATGMMLKGLLIVIEFLFKANKKYMRDYKIAIVRTMERRRRRRHENNVNQWLMAGESNNEAQLNTTLHFWCLNPAVAFSDFGSDVRCIILTSGTLSPMNSFASELGVNFPIQLEANHVIHKSQVWVGTVALGPSGTSLNASYRNAETFAFQDDIGRLLLHVCEVIPYGVLCFLPSYSMLSKLMDRWQTTGTWDKLLEKKQIMMETRGGDKTEFDEQLRDYYQLIKDCEETNIETQSVTGGLFFAVCRGKVSEGMDFADNNARAVITIGIPFPSFKDTQVELKRQYNDNYSSSRGLLTGSEWYEIQAYRALNQALGRCIRHKMDWGALILVDERYNRNPKKYISGLSKWVRAKVYHHIHSRDAICSLSEFAQARLLKPCPEISDASTSSPQSTQSPTSAGPSTVNTAGFTPSQITTPSVKVESASGYTPIANTPVRSTSTVPPFNNTITPNIVKGGGACATTTPNMVNGASTNGSQQSGAWTVNSTSQVFLVNGLFVKASSILPHGAKSMQVGTSGRGDNTSGQRSAGASCIQMAVSEQAAPNASRVVPAGCDAQNNNVVEHKAHASTGNKMTTSGDGPVSLKTPLFHGRTVTSPEQGEVLVDDDTSIATPKAKLNFAEGKGIVTPKPTFLFRQSCAEKLKKFARKASTDEAARQPSKPNASKFYKFVDLTSDEDASKSSANETNNTVKQDDVCQEKHGTIEPSHNQQMEKDRREFNQTPPLFDSEFTGSSEDTVIPESPERTKASEMESRVRKRKLGNDASTGEITEEVVELEPEAIKTKDESGQVILDGQKSRPEEMPSGKSRRGKLSRRKSEEMKSPVKTKCDEQETSNQDADCHGDEPDAQVALRRSVRRRHGPDKGGRHGKIDSSDFLDTIGDGSPKKVGKCLPACRSGLFCLHCSEDLSADLQDVQSISSADLPSEFLKKQTKYLHSKTTKRSKKANTCQCQQKGKASSKSSTHAKSDASDQDVWLIARKELLKHCEPVAEGGKVQKGMTLNAHWNEKDQCCYRQVTCGSCPKGFIQLGYEVLASNNDRLPSGQVRLSPCAFYVYTYVTCIFMRNEQDQCCYRQVTCGSCPKGFIHLGYEVLASNNDRLPSGQVRLSPCAFYVYTYVTCIFMRNEQDQCCYRQVTCGSCPKGFIQLGYEVLASNNDRLPSGQVRLSPCAFYVYTYVTCIFMRNEQDQCCYRQVTCGSCLKGFIQLGYEVLASNNDRLPSGQVRLSPCAFYVYTYVTCIFMRNEQDQCCYRQVTCGSCLKGFIQLGYEVLASNNDRLPSGQVRLSPCAFYVPMLLAYS